MVSIYATSRRRSAKSRISTKTDAWDMNDLSRLGSGESRNFRKAVTSPNWLRPVSFGSLGSKDVPRGLQSCRRETTVSVGLGDPRMQFSQAIRPENHGVGNAVPCSP